MEEVLLRQRHQFIVCDRIKKPSWADDIMYTFVHDQFDVIRFSKSQSGFRKGLPSLTRGTPPVHNEQPGLILRHLDKTPSMRSNPITIQRSAHKGHNPGRPLTALAVVPYLRRESSTWDPRRPLGLALKDVASDHARSSLNVSPSNKLDSI